MQDRICVRLRRATGFELDVDVGVRSGGVTALFGPSGCGKTTVLRIAAGLERARGFVRIAGRTWQDDEKGIFVPTCERRLGYVFQEASLFVHLNVEQNLCYGLKRMHDVGGQKRLEEAVELLGIGHLLGRRVNELSGGERQRCAIARSLVTCPAALFMDEPLAALDHARRLEIMPWLERIKRELNIPVVYVTHSEEEVLRLADTLVVMENGQVKLEGAVADVWHQLGRQTSAKTKKSSLVQAVVLERDADWGLVKAAAGEAYFWVRDAGFAIGDKLRLMIDADDVSISVQKPSRTSIQNVFACRAADIFESTDASRRFVELDAGCGCKILAEVTARSLHEMGISPDMRVWAQVKSVSVH